MVQMDSLIISHYILIHVDMSLWNNIYYKPEWIMKLFGGLTCIEMACLAHMLHSPVYCYDASQRYHIWAAYFPNNVDRSIPRDSSQRSLFIYFSINHFQVVTTVRSR